jgi:hypothetical protein
VIYCLEDGFHTRLGPGVIDGRPEVHEQHRYGKNARTDEKREAAVVERRQKQNRRANRCRDESEPMADTVRQFLAS